MPAGTEGKRLMRVAEDRTNWVLAHPGFSAWLKTALAESRGRDPIELLNELEVLDSLIRARCAAELSWMVRSEER